MRILLIGSGKMGQEIELIALSRGHEITARLNSKNKDKIGHYLADEPDVAIEFTNPESAYSNIKKCIDAQVPVISGSTGWLKDKKNIDDYCKLNNGAFLYASNFSLGVNLFFKLNSYLAKLMRGHSNYNVSIEEVHHTEKKDAPSGTAISLAEQIMAQHKNFQGWQLATESKQMDLLSIKAIRKPHVPGTHTVSYQAEVDTLSITHQAHSRMGFALGAVIAAEWICGKKGVFSMENVLDLS